MVALDDVSLEIAPGERLALIGENGAGKSSLMNVLFGLYQPDAGQIEIDGQPVRMRSPKDAIARGVGMVHQHFMLVPSLTIAENVILGKEPTRGLFLDLRTASQEVKATCERFGFALDPLARVEDLTVGSQQKVEIVKALHRGAKTLILDEPTAVLTPQEADELFAVTRELSAAGHAVVFITHKLREVLSVATRIAVMRKGSKVAEVAPEATTRERLAELMISGRRTEVGASLSPASPPDLASIGWTGAAQQSSPQSPTAADSRGPSPSLAPLRESSSDLIATLSPVAPTNARKAAELPSRQRAGLADRSPQMGAPVFELRGASAGRLREVSLSVRAGEIVGIAGVDGNGQRELAEVAAGLRRLEQGSLHLAGESILRPDPSSLRARGVAHVPEDRLRHAVVGPMSVEENLSLGRQRSPPFAHRQLIDFQGRRARAEGLIRDYDVRPASPLAQVVALSGGNQQKVVVARELDASPSLLVVVQPTRGLDLVAVASVHAKLRAARDRGCAVLLVSLDLEELLALADRIYVLFEGRLNGELDRSDFDERELGRRMLGGGGREEIAHG